MSKALNSSEIDESPFIISLGGWCRPAWQIRRFFRSERAYPYDWHITSFSALAFTLSPLYNHDSELRAENCLINQFGSITDNYSGLVFQHDLPAEIVGEWCHGVFLRNDGTVGSLLSNVREKQKHIFSRFREVATSGSPIIFVRWLRGGHPDTEWPEAFNGENPFKTYKLVKEFCGHENFKLLYVATETCSEDRSDNPASITPTSYGGFVQLNELDSNFVAGNEWTGDSAAWDKLFLELKTNWIDLSNNISRESHNEHLEQDHVTLSALESDKDN